MEKRSKKITKTAVMAYILSGLLMAFYLVVLYLSLHPRVSEDYRMRYLEEGYFWEKHEEG